MTAEQQKTTFQINVRGYVVLVAFTPDYFPGRDHFAFLSPHEPRRPHPVSETGYRSHFAVKADVEKAGGPEPFARWYAEQIAADKDPKPRKKLALRAVERVNVPTEGGHAAKVEERPVTPLTQRELF